MMQIMSVPIQPKTNSSQPYINNQSHSAGTPNSPTPLVTKPTTLACSPTSDTHCEKIISPKPVSTTPNSLPSNAVSPTSPSAASLIGILPNGVHVSRVPYSYSPEVKSVLKKVLPTCGDAIKAANLTAQLTLQCMMKMNTPKVNSSTLPKSDRSVSPHPILPHNGVGEDSAHEITHPASILKDPNDELPVKQTASDPLEPVQVETAPASPVSSFTSPVCTLTVTKKKPVKQRSPDLSRMNDLQVVVRDIKRSKNKRKRKQHLLPLEDSESTFEQFVAENDCKEPEPKKTCTILKHTTTSDTSKIGYVKRMASLNARACVTAMMEPEKKLPAKKSRSASSKNKMLFPPSKSRKSNIPDLSSALDELTSGIDADKFVCVKLGEHLMDDPMPVFNTLGLLYDGSTMHPTRCRVFYSGSSVLTLPRIIIPTLTPSRVDSVGMSVEKALSVKRSSKKTTKGNNGWISVGGPIKTVQYTENDVTTTRKYYIGIQRKKDEVFVRDCVLLRSGREDKPYVAKVGSIWRESDGLMMTLFWYYRPEEIDAAATVGVQFQKNELLASQHVDTNSVECIEEKCHILGLKQYCRYHAAVVSSKYSSTQPHGSAVPALPTRDHKTPYVSHVTSDSSHMMSCDKAKSYCDLGPTIGELIQTDPSLVYICYRGYNHINGRLSQL